MKSSNFKQLINLQPSAQNKKDVITSFISVTQKYIFPILFLIMKNTPKDEFTTIVTIFIEFFQMLSFPFQSRVIIHLTLIVRLNMEI